MALNRRSIVNLVFFLVAGLAGVALLLRWYEPHLLYYPLTRLDATPAQAGLEYEDVHLTTADGVVIHGWYLPHPRARATVVFLHGNAGNIAHRLEKLVLLHQLEVNTLIIDYRGYGQSEGVADEAGTYADAEAVMQHVRTIASGPVVLYGESLGAAVAVEMATRHPVAGLILEEPFTSVAAVGQRLFPFLPLRLLVRNRYDSLSKIPRIRAPLLVFHSRTDEVIPYRLGARLFAAAPEPKTFVELRGGHNDAFLTSRDQYQSALASFLASVRDQN